MKKLLLPVLLAVWLAGCQTMMPSGASAVSDTPDAARAKVTQPQEKIIAYFDERWKPVARPVSKGYFRKLYGQTAQGHYIAQDFYQKDGARQTDAFEIIDEAGLKDGGSSYITGVVVVYAADGSKKAMETFANGKAVGPHEKYYPDGTLKIRIMLGENTSSTVDVFYEDGAKMGHITKGEQGKLLDLQVWHPNGQRASEVRVQGTKRQIKGWDANGKPLSTRKAAAQVLKFNQFLNAV